MVTYTKEFRAMRFRFFRAVAISIATVVASIWLTRFIPPLPHSPYALQRLLDALPLILGIAGIAVVTFQTDRLYRCPSCGVRIDRGNKGACRACGLSFGYES